MTYWVCTESETVPSTSQLIAGQDHTGATAEASGSQPVTAVGPQATDPVDGLLDGETYSFHLMHRDAGGNASDTLTTTVTVPLPSAPPVLSGLTPSANGTTATLGYDTSEGSGGMYWVLTDSTSVPETWRIKRAEDHAGNPALADGSQRPSTAGAQPNIVVTGLTEGSTYHFHMYHRANGETSAIASASVTLEDQAPTDTTVPVLSNVSASLADTTATLNWSSDEGNGTGYWVCTTAATQPSETQLIAGQDHTGAAAFSSGAQAVSAPGAQADQVVSGLTSGPTYFFHLLQRDASGNTSARVSTTGVTVASSGVSAEISIINRSVTEVAPEGIVFDITNLTGFDTAGPAGGEVYDPQLHDLYYYWDFGDSYQFQAPEKLIPQFMDSGIGYGPKVSHTYREPGTYNVSCLIVEPSSGKSVTVQLNVSIGDPDALYSGTRTVFVDSTGAGTGAPVGALVRTTLDAAFSEVYTGSSSTPRRIMIRRDQTFTPSSLDVMGQTNNRMNTLICAGPGAGAKPIIDTTNVPLTWGFATGATIDCELKIQDVVFQGPWDVTTQSGTSQVCFALYENRPKQTLIDRCEFSGYSLAIYPAFNQVVSPDPFIICNDSVFTDWRNAALFGDANWVGTGNRIAQNPDALSGFAEGEAETSTISCVRFPRADYCIWQQNDMFSRTGWTVNVPGIYTLQSCFRGNTYSQLGAFYNCWGNVFEGGVASFSIDVDDTNVSNPINAVVDRNITVGYHDSYRSMEFGFSGITVRNNVCIIPSGNRYGIGIFGFVTFNRRTDGGEVPENRDAPSRVYNNTCVCNVTQEQLTGGAVPVVETYNGYTNISESNNVNLQPDRGLAVAGLDTTVLWTPRYTHYEDDNTSRDNTRATPADSISLYRPQIGSPVLGDALNGSVAYDDFFGNVRPQYPSLGAFEVD